jgi:hypothetical protein
MIWSLGGGAGFGNKVLLCGGRGWLWGFLRQGVGFYDLGLGGVGFKRGGWGWFYGGSSLVDYMVASPALFDCATSLVVHKCLIFCGKGGDYDHMPLSLNLQLPWQHVSSTTSESRANIWRNTVVQRQSSHTEGQPLSGFNHSDTWA